MRRTVILSLLVLAAAAALVLGSFSALAGSGPVSGVAGAVFGDDDGGDVVAQANGDDAEGTQRIAEAIADVEEFGATPEEVLALHDQGIGFGAIFKLYALASAMGFEDVDALLATLDKNEDGEYEFAFGKLWQSLDETQAAALDELPKNLGQTLKAFKAGEDGDAVAAGAPEKAHGKFAAKGSQGHGRPEGVPGHSD